MTKAAAYSETDALHAFIEQVPFALPDVRVFRRTIVNVETKDGWRARSGIPGQADAYALVRGGRHVEIETKSATHKLEPAQIAWRAYCASFAIPYMQPRVAKGETMEETVQRWIDELRSVLA